jgi:subtilisin-like proprotein convertase family protein
MKRISEVCMKFMWSILSVSFIIFLISSCEFLLFPTSSTKTYTNDTGWDITEGNNDFEISVSDSGQVVTVESVSLDELFHDYASDLTISLISPGGISKALVTKKGSSSSYTGDYTFVDDDDSSGLPRIIEYSGDVVPETYQAESDFDDFSEVNVNGPWTLRITDSESDIDGTLAGWSMTLEFED